MSEAIDEASQKEVINDFKLIATRLNVDSLQRELGMHLSQTGQSLLLTSAYRSDADPYHVPLEDVPAKPVPTGLYNIG